MSTSIVDIFKADCPRRLDKIQLKYAENPPVEKNGDHTDSPILCTLDARFDIDWATKVDQMLNDFCTNAAKNGHFNKVELVQTPDNCVFYRAS